MKLWKRAVGALKDRTSIWLASLSAAPRGRNPPLETFIIKATSHDKDSIDLKNSRRVLASIRTSSSNLSPLHLALSSRVANTRSWPVALKSLILMHRLLCSNIHLSVASLPFDLSAFRSPNHRKHSAYDYFIRSYFDFLYHRSSLHNSLGKCAKQHEDHSVEHELKKLVKLQSLLDRLLKVKPREEGMRVFLILEAMDCIAIEIFEIYDKICSGIANVLLRIYTARKEEATLALTVIQKAMEQGDHLTHYFEYCDRIGVLGVLECPPIEKIPDKDVREIEQMINGEAYRKPVSKPRQQYEDEKAIVVMSKDKGLRTIITDKWEVFEDTIQTAIVPLENDDTNKEKREDPFADFFEFKPRYPPDYQMPDLITF